MSAHPNYILFDPDPKPPDSRPGPNLLVEWEHGWESFTSSIRPALARSPRIRGDMGFLFICWESGWKGFKHAIKPALSRSEPPLEGECAGTARHGRSDVLSLVLHIATILVVIAIPTHILHTQQVLANEAERQYQVIYYSGNELPQMDDVGGSEAGRSGASGGRELYNPTQVIHISRGNKLVDTVADAPHMKLPVSNEPVANLLTMPARDPGPAPAAALRSLVAAAGVLPQPVAVQPSPRVTRTSLQSAPDLASGAINAPPDATRQVAGLRLPEIGAAQVIPPPISVAPREGVTNAKLALPMSVAVAPPPQVVRGVSNVGVTGFGATNDVVPPAPQVGGRALAGAGIPGGIGTGTMDAVPPPPRVGANGSSDGGVVGGAMKALGSMLGSITGSGSGGGSSAIVVSGNPGGAVGMPGNGGLGSLAMSPNGGNEPGLGGYGGGTGTGHGAGTGSGASGTGSGSGNGGSGFGNGLANSGTSHFPGPGGSGTGSGEPGIPGVTIQGGKVTIPGFSTPSDRDPSALARGPKEPRNRPPITVIASARAGGALNMYGAFKGAKVYTIYIDTRIGPVILQYAERSVGVHKFEEDLTAPEPMRSDLPTDAHRSRLLVSCIMDKSGTLKNVRVLESAHNEFSANLMSAIEKWQFRPVLRGEEPVEVDAVLGFDIDTR